MDKFESELQAAAKELLASLRQGKGFDKQSAGRLKSALRMAAEAWADATVISKSAANLFVDLASGVDACSYAYTGEEANEIKKLADEIADLVRICVGFPRANILL